jgi:anaerobic selenocysteine-containing dehydrogenase
MASLPPRRRIRPITRRIARRITRRITTGRTSTARAGCRRDSAAPSAATAHVGDVPVGGTITLGAGLTGGSSDDWFRSEYLVLWAFNPATTRIPDAHFLNEARYRGARVVSITPDYGSSAHHADLWLSPRPGTDAATT